MILTLDAHCDTLGQIVKQGYDFESNKLCFNLQNIKKTVPHIQFFACFINSINSEKNPLIDIIKMIDKYYYLMQKYSHILESAYCYEDIIKVTNQNKCASLLWLEGGDALNGELSVLNILYRLGIRGITLTWNNRNEIACGIEDKIDTGLTDFGKKIIREMNRLGMIVDVSHLGELGFWQVLNLALKPIVASHSNAKKICSHKRNLTDEQIIEISKNNGVVGINFCPSFLNNQGSASMDDILRHIEHICGLVGYNHIGFGTDFDGIDTVPKGVENISCINNIIEELAKRNYTEEQIESIANKNFLRVIKECL